MDTSSMDTLEQQEQKGLAENEESPKTVLPFPKWALYPSTSQLSGAMIAWDQNVSSFDSFVHMRFNRISSTHLNNQKFCSCCSTKSENTISNSSESNRRKDRTFRNLPKRGYFENKEAFDRLVASLKKINHSKEKSDFAVVTPRTQSQLQTFNKYSYMCFKSSHKEVELTSDCIQFKPINEKLENRTGGKYADGTTFKISSNLDRRQYMRSDSGSMLLVNELGQAKKYRALDLEESNSRPEFVLKFSVNQNDKACQTQSEDEVPLPKLNLKSFSEYRSTTPLDLPYTEPRIRIEPFVPPESMMAYMAWKCSKEYGGRLKLNHVGDSPLPVFAQLRMQGIDKDSEQLPVIQSRQNINNYWERLLLHGSLLSATSQFEEDCLIQLSNLTTLHSVI